MHTCYALFISGKTADPQSSDGICPYLHHSKYNPHPIAKISLDSFSIPSHQCIGKLHPVNNSNKTSLCDSLQSLRVIDPHPSSAKIPLKATGSGGFPKARTSHTSCEVAECAPHIRVMLSNSSFRTASHVNQFASFVFVCV